MLRRWTLAFLFAAGPMAMACEAALDFDRSPLQDYDDAGQEAGEDDDGSTTSPKKDAAAASDAADDVQQTMDAATDARDAQEGG